MQPENRSGHTITEPFKPRIESANISQPVIRIDPFVNELNVYKERQPILEKLRNFDYLIVSASPGTGKSTTLPILMYEGLQQEYPGGPNIVELQPRRNTVENNTKQIAKWMYTPVGELVGYQHKLDKKRSDKTKILLEIDASLIGQYKNDPLLSNIDILIPDEIHEASANMVMALALAKKANLNRAAENAKPEAERKRTYKALKVIPTSGTIDPEPYRKYYGRAEVHKVKDAVLGNLEKHFEDFPVSESEMPAKAASTLIKNIIQPNLSGDVLIVTPGRSEIEKTREAIETTMASMGIPKESIEMIDFDSSTPQKIRDEKIFSEHTNRRRVIIATSIADTGTTLDIENVIDTGLIKLPHLDQYGGLIDHQAAEAAQSVILQRRNRVARKPGSIGRVWHLFTVDQFNKRVPYQEPEIQRTDISALMLKVKDLGFDFGNLDLIVNPNETQVARATQTLQMLDALDQNGNLTEVGKAMAQYETEPNLSRMMVEAKRLGVYEGAATIAAIKTNVRDLFYGKRQDWQEKLKRYFDTSSDFFTYLNLWNDIQQNKGNPTWMENMGINPDTVGKIEAMLVDDLRVATPRAIDLSGDNRKNLSAAIITGHADKLLTNIAPKSVDYDYRFRPEVHTVMLSERSSTRPQPPNYPIPDAFISGEISLYRHGKKFASWNHLINDSTIITQLLEKIARIRGEKPLEKLAPIPKVEPIKTTLPLPVSPTPSKVEAHQPQQEVSVTQKEESLWSKVRTTLKNVLHTLDPRTWVQKIKEFLKGK